MGAKRKIKQHKQYLPTSVMYTCNPAFDRLVEERGSIARVTTIKTKSKPS